MNPQLALELANQRQSQLRREQAARLPRVGFVKPLHLATETGARLRRAFGWLLVELGLRLALSRDGERVSRVGASEVP